MPYVCESPTATISAVSGTDLFLNPQESWAPELGSILYLNTWSDTVLGFRKSIGSKKSLERPSTTNSAIITVKNIKRKFLR
jgi:hypothetical protein